MVADLPSPVPIGSLLPDLYQRRDGNIMVLTEALDEVLAPVWLVLDCFDSYLDPLLAPLDFVEMLAAWTGFEIDQNWSEEQTRRLVATAVELYRWRGTKTGLTQLVVAYSGVEPVIDDSGGTIWSASPGGEPPGTPDQAVRVTVELPADTATDLARLTRLIASYVPAHVHVSVEIRRTSAPARATTSPPPAPPAPATDE